MSHENTKTRRRDLNVLLFLRAFWPILNSPLDVDARNFALFVRVLFDVLDESAKGFIQ